MDRSTPIRIIPRLDVKGPNLVKGIHVEGLRVLGKPERFARHYYEQGADELIYNDVVASLYRRGPRLEVIERVATGCFIPLCVAGGVRSIEEVGAVLRAGADKVALNTAAIRDPDFLAEAVRVYGSSTIVVMIEAVRHFDGSIECLTDAGREPTRMDPVAWAVRAAEIGCGEILVTSVSRDGTGKGYDLDLTRRIVEQVSVPVIASGGGGRPEHVLDLVKETGADAVAPAALLHYEACRRFPFDEGDYAEEGNVEWLKLKPPVVTITETSLPGLKRHLASHGVPVRPAQ